MLWRMQFFSYDLTSLSSKHDREYSMYFTCIPWNYVTTTKRFLGTCASPTHIVTHFVTKKKTFIQGQVKRPSTPFIHCFVVFPLILCQCHQGTKPPVDTLDTFFNLKCRNIDVDYWFFDHFDVFTPNTWVHHTISEVIWILRSPNKFTQFNTMVIIIIWSHEHYC